MQTITPNIVSVNKNTSANVFVKLFVVDNIPLTFPSLQFLGARRDNLMHLTHLELSSDVRLT